MATKLSKVPAFLAEHDGRKEGTYVVSTRNGCWGRGDTLAEALRNAKNAGGRTGPKDVMVAWQPDSAWQAIKAEFGEKTEAAKPYVDLIGRMCSWGNHIETLYEPKDVK